MRRSYPVWFRLGRVRGRCVDLDVPTEFVDAFRERLDHLWRRCSRLCQVEADPACSLLMHAFQLGIGDRVIDNYNGTRLGSESGDGVQRDAVIGAIG